ncbi:hypothetical protein [Enhygromyxa salina]|nr:hypothetical protein [Enhygromyxa salina]
MLPLTRRPLVLAWLAVLALAGCSDEPGVEAGDPVEDPFEDDPLLEDPEPSGNLVLQLGTIVRFDNLTPTFVGQMALADVSLPGALDLSVVTTSDVSRGDLLVERAPNSSWVLYEFENGDAAELQGDGSQFLVDLARAPTVPVPLAGHNPVARFAPDGRYLARVDGEGQRTLALHPLSEAGVGEPTELASADSIEILGFSSDSDYLVFTSTGTNADRIQLGAVRLGANGPSEALVFAELPVGADLRELRALPARVDISVERLDAETGTWNERLYAIELDSWPEPTLEELHHHASNIEGLLRWQFSSDGKCAIAQEADRSTLLLRFDDEGRVIHDQTLVDFGLSSRWKLSPTGCFGFVTNSVVSFSYVGYQDLLLEGEVPFPQFTDPQGARDTPMYVGNDWATWKGEDEALMVIRFDVETREVSPSAVMMPYAGYGLEVHQFGERVLVREARTLSLWDPAGPNELEPLVAFQDGAGFEQLAYSPLDGRVFYTYDWVDRLELGVVDADQPGQARTVLRETTDTYGPLLDLYAPGYGELLLD